MQDTNDTEKKPSLMHRFMERFGKKRLIIGAVIVLFGIWAANVVIGWFGAPEPSHEPVAVRHVTPAPQAQENITVKEPPPVTPPDVHRATAEGPKNTYSDKDVSAPMLPAAPKSATRYGAATDHGAAAATGRYQTGYAEEETPPPVIKGVAFIGAVVSPLGYELNERFWGWRPNDIVNVTDNVNNFQLGVLEVTRRTAVVLAERLSRTGSTASFDRDLENAMNWLMIRPTQYWFPSPESMYGDALKAMKSYQDRIARGAAPFYTRSDNLIPLLMAFEDLLGSSDENLVKHYEADGKPVSFFKADDYIFYAKGVASAMHPILEAVAIDFQKTLEARRGVDVLHNAIESLEHAMKIAPIVVTDSSLSGILANHRANMAAPISHARFFLGVLIKTLST